MKNDDLDKIWELQANASANLNPENIFAKAKTQRNEQYISITVMSLTLVILIAYTFYYAYNQWNTFNLGLMLMISSLVFRISLEFYSLYRKDKQLISMPQRAYYSYLQKFYKTRLVVNYVITPICIAVYSFGFYLLLPYFKDYFSSGFYTYILISGVLSIAVVVAIIVNSIRKEQRFLDQLQKR